MSDVGSRDDTVTKQQGGYKIRQVFGAIAIVFFLAVSPLLAETVLVGTFFNGNNAFLNSRAYIWNPTDADADITARVYTLPRSGNSTLLGTVSLGQLNARSGRNIKIAEDILLALGVLLPYTGDGGNLMVEFTVGADNVRGTGQVFASDLAFGTSGFTISDTRLQASSCATGQISYTSANSWVMQTQESP